jgi:outer membrane protein
MKSACLIAVSVMATALVLSVSWAEAANKTGFVDVRKVLLTSNAGKNAAADYNKAFEKNKKMIQDSESALKKLQDEIEKECGRLKKMDTNV